MDCDRIRIKLGELRIQAEEILSQLGVADAGSGAAALGFIDQFASAVDRAIARSEEESGTRAALERFLDVLPPESVKDEFERLKEALSSKLQSLEPLSDIAKPYELFVRLVDKPDLDLSEDFDVVDGFFGMRLMRPLYLGKYSFATPAQTGIGGGVPSASTDSETCVLGGVSESVLEEKSSLDNGVPVASEDEVSEQQGNSEQQDSSSPENDEDESESLESESVNLQEILPRYEIFTQKTETSFSVKTFTNDYFQVTRSGKALYRLNRKGELRLMCWFAYMGALTKPQMEKYLFGNDTGNTHVEKLCKGGYVSVVTHKDSGLEFYTLSAKGIEIFKRKKSRDLIEAINPPPYQPLNYESELTQMDADIDAYQYTATVALRFNDSKVVKCRIERIHADTKIPIVLLELWTKRSNHYLVVTGVSKKVLLLPLSPKDYPIARMEQKKCLIRLAKATCSDADGCKRHYCTVSEDHTVVSCFDPGGNSVDLDKYVENHVLPASEDDKGKSLFDGAEPSELLDLIDWLTPDLDKPLRFKEFVERFKQYIPDNDRSDAFKDLVKRFKQLPPDDEEFFVFKKFIENIRQKFVPKHDGKNVSFKKIINSIKLSDLTAEKTVGGAEAAVDAADDLKPSDGADSDDAADTAHTDPFLMARQILDKRTIAPSKDKERFDALVSLLLDALADATSDENTDYIGRAVVLRKTLALADEKIYDADYHRLLLAVDMPLDDRSYSMEELSTYFSGENEGTAFHLAALLRALFLPASQYEYSLTDYAREIFKRYDQVFGAYIELKGTLGVFIEIADVSVDGFTDEVVSRFIDEDSKSQFIKGLSSDAVELRKIPHINQRFNGVPEMLEMSFGQDSELGLCMSCIAENKESDRDFVSKVYESFIEGGKASQQKIDRFIDERWKEVRHNSKKWIRNDDIVSTARQKINYAICQRLEIINRWLAYAASSSNGRDDALGAMYSKTKKSLKSAEEFLREDRSLPKQARAVLFRAVENLSLRLSGKHPVSFLKKDWLSTGVFAVTDAGLPVINEDYGDILYYEPWRNILRHIAKKPARDLRDTLTKIENVEDPLYDNLGQAVAICEYLGIDTSAYQNSVKNAREDAEKHQVREFEERLGLDFAYGRIGDQSKETVIEDLERVKPEFFERNDFAGLRCFLAALRDGMNDEIAEKRKYWEAAISERRNGGSPDKFKFLERAAKQLEKGENANFILVEESLNLFDGKADSNQSDLDFSDDDHFSEFITQRKYNSLEDLCNKNKSGSLRGFAEKFVKDRIRESAKYKESALRLLQNFPNSPEKSGCEEIPILLTELGFTVSTVKRDNPGQSPAIFTVGVTPNRKNAESYKHPIAEMGTNMGDTLRVVELFGRMEPRSIIDAVPKSGSRRTSIVLLNGYLTLAQRQQLARLFLKDGNAQTPFILVDWILLLHLAQKYKDDRLSVMLACAMPYTGCHQLFSANSVMPVADEMYIGRMEEIRQITDKNGPVFVYGGRQLGKTAVLLRAKNVYHAPKDGNYGVYVDVKDCRDEASFVTALTDKMREVNADFVSVKTTIKAMCDEIREWLSKSNNRRLLLLIDESDDILSVLAENRYIALNEFERLSKETGRFKFVFAGLHNVFAAAKDSNTIFGHFGKPICIRPLSQSDAYKLLARPLRYLGFNTDPDTLLPLIVNTNFYPGVVHFVGTELVKMLIHNYSKHYNEFDNPPYQLDDRQIGSVMHSAGLSGMIEERIRLTLEVDTRYFMLARCIAALYYEDVRNRSSGYDVDKIIEYAALLEIDVLQSETKEQCENLLSEMCDMSLLVNMAGRYRFRQSRFLNIVGKDIGDILDQIARAKEGA